MVDSWEMKRIVDNWGFRGLSALVCFSESVGGGLFVDVGLSNSFKFLLDNRMVTMHGYIAYEKINTEECMVHD